MREKMQQCGQCDYSIRNEDKMLKHLSKIHGIHIGIYSSKNKINAKQIKAKINAKQIEANLERVKKMKIDGRMIVAILGTLLTRAKKIQREIKKKDLKSGRLHDLNVQSRTLSDLIGDMLVELTKEMLRQQLKLAKKKRTELKKRKRQQEINKVFTKVGRK